MKALRWHARRDVRLDELPAPQPGFGELVLRVARSGICGSEVHEYYEGPVFIPLEPHPLLGCQAPQIMGHEYGGWVEAIGPGVEGFQPGDLVAVDPIRSCGICPACRRGRQNLCSRLACLGLIGDGGHAGLSLVPAANCIPVPEGTPPEAVAFGEPATVARHAVGLASIQPGARVAVVGGGPIGQLAAQFAKLAGASQVWMTEIAPRRIEIAAKVGAVDEVLNPLDCDVTEALLERTGGEGVDVSLECSGGAKTGLLRDTAALAVDLTRAEGTTVVVGTFVEPTSFSFNNLVLMERRVIGSWAWHEHSEFVASVEAMVSGQIDYLSLITAQVSLEDAVQEGIKALKYKRDEHLKILIDPQR